MSQAFQNLCLCFILLCGLEWSATVSAYMSDFDYRLYQFMAAYLNVSHLVTHCNTSACFEEVVIAAQKALNERGIRSTSPPITSPAGEDRGAFGKPFRLNIVPLVGQSFQGNSSEPPALYIQENSSSTFVVIDFTQCGTFPACGIQSMSGNRWRLDCNENLTAVIVMAGVLLSVLVTVSNVLIIFITLQNKSLRKPHGYFKLSLALADLIAGAFVLPSIIYNTLTTINYDAKDLTVQDLFLIINQNDAYSVSGNFFGVLSILSTVTAAYSLLLLSADTFFSVKWPMRYRVGDVMTSRRAVVAVGLVWFLSLIIGFLPLLAEELVKYRMHPITYQFLPFTFPIPSVPIGTSPALRYLHALIYSVLAWGLPFVVTWALTIMTSLRSWTMLESMREARKRSVKSERILNRVDRQLIRTVAVVLILFTLTILPFFVVAIATINIPENECSSKSYAWAFFFSTYVFIIGRFLNVVVYNVMNKDFREASNKLFINLKQKITCENKLEEGLPKRSLSSRKSSSLSDNNSRKGRKQLSSRLSNSKETEIPSPSPIKEANLDKKLTLMKATKLLLKSDFEPSINACKVNPAFIKNIK